MSRLLAAACLVVTASGCAISSGPTTVSDLFGLECRTDLLESVVNDYGAVTGQSSVEEALAEFFESEGRRFTGLESLEPAADDLERAFVDSAGLIQLRVQLTDEYGGYLVAGYSYCTG